MFIMSLVHKLTKIIILYNWDEWFTVNKKLIKLFLKNYQALEICLSVYVVYMDYSA